MLEREFKLQASSSRKIDRLGGGKRGQPAISLVALMPLGGSAGSEGLDTVESPTSRPTAIHFGHSPRRTLCLCSGTEVEAKGRVAIF